MNIPLTELMKKLDELSILEAKGHLDHPEDLVFLDGSAGATRAVNAIIATVKNPKTVTLKYDGYPALIFGRNVDGKFGIMDKHMFNKKDMSGRQIFSPDQFKKYDLDRGVDRSALHNLIAEIWPGLERASTGTTGYYWGDLLFSQPLKPVEGLYRFRANPNGITYTVDPQSDLGKLMAGKSAGIAVHQYLNPAALSTDDAQTLDGSIGQLKNNGNVAIVPSAMPNTPKIQLDQKLVSSVNSVIKKYGNAADQLMNTAPQARNTFNQLFTTYINSRIVSGDLSDLLQGFMEYVNNRPMTDTMRNKINQHLQTNKDGLVGVFTIWIAIYNLKTSIVNQLADAAKESPVQGYLQDGTNTQEGFVAQGLKFIDRLGFSRQNLQGR